MEKRKIISLLKELRKISGEIYLFGYHRDQSQLERIIRNRYSTLYKFLLDKEYLDEDLFQIDNNSTLDEISSNIALLVSYLEDSEY